MKGEMRRLTSADNMMVATICALTDEELDGVEEDCLLSLKATPLCHGPAEASHVDVVVRWELSSSTQVQPIRSRIGSYKTSAVPHFDISSSGHVFGAPRSRINNRKYTTYLGSLIYVVRTFQTRISQWCIAHCTYSTYPSADEYDGHQPVQ